MQYNRTNEAQMRRSLYMQRVLPRVALLAAVGFLLFLAAPVHAQDAVANLTTVGVETGLSGADPRILLARIIRAALSVLGIILVVLVIYAGFLWMTARGDEAKVETAKKVLINAGIGLVIIMSSLAITQYVLNQLLVATGLSGRQSEADELIAPFSSSLGAGMIDNHFPRRNASDVPRNTNIVVTFRQAVDPTTVLVGFDAANPTAPYPIDVQSVTIRPTDEAAAADLGLSALLSSEVSGAVTPDFKTFVFDPSPLLGTAAVNVDYTVELSSRIDLVGGQPAFTGASSGGYQWTFDVSTVVDTTPPSVRGVVPVASSTVPRNILVQVEYSEAVNPIATVGTAPAFTNVQVTATSSIIGGDWSLANEYRTSEFVSSTACGTNSCGETIYCLPGDVTVSGLVRAATLSSEPPTAVFPYAGVVDMAGNALDGNGDGVAGDDYVWSFNTNNTIVLDPPRVDDVNPPLVSPGVPAQNIPFDSTVNVTFDTLMSVASINANTIQLLSPTEQVWFTTRTAAVDPTGEQVVQPNVLTDRSRVTVSHGVFSAERLYGVNVGAGVRSIFQNCFIPSTSAVCAGPNCCNDLSSTTQCTYP